MSIVYNYNYIFGDISDQRTIKWPLMSGPIQLTIIVLLYLYVVKYIGPLFMAKRRPFRLKRIIQMYNVLQVLSCSWLIYEVHIIIKPHRVCRFGIDPLGAAIIAPNTNRAYCMQLEYFFAKFSIYGRLVPFVCHYVDFSDNPNAVYLAELCWWTLILKLCEFIETVFFVLRKKYNQVSNLHLYHHVSTVLLIWISVKYQAGGMAVFTIVLNSFVHVIMYSYYFLSTLGPKWQKKLGKWKPKLTIIQMVQFCFLLAHGCSTLRDDCNVPDIFAYFFLPDVLIIFYMFYQFYRKSYLNKTKPDYSNAKYINN